MGKLSVGIDLHGRPVLYLASLMDNRDVHCYPDDLAARVDERAALQVDSRCDLRERTSLDLVSLFHPVSGCRR